MHCIDIGNILHYIQFTNIQSIQIEHISRKRVTPIIKTP